MRLKKYACRCFAVVCAIVSVACQENIETIDKVNTEVSVLQERTTLPLGSFEGASLGDLIGEDKQLPEGFVRTEEGYEFQFKIDTTISAGEDFSVPSFFEIPGSSSKFPVSLPKLSLDGLNFKIGTGANEIPALSAFSSAIEKINSLAPGSVENSIEIKDEYFHNEFFEFPQEILIESDEPISIKIEPVKFELPEQIKDITKIVLAKSEDEPGAPGAPIELDIDLDGLAGINAGGTISFTLTPKGNIDLVLYNNGEVVEKNEQTGSYLVEQEIEAKKADASLKFYIAEVLLNRDEESEGQDVESIDIDLSMDCDFSFYLKLEAGELILKDENGDDAEPSFAMSANIGLEDAYVKFNNDKPLFSFDAANGNGFSFDIDGLPEQLESINSIALKDAKLTLFAKGLEWLNDAGYGDVVSIDMTLPEVFVLTANKGNFDTANHKLSITLGEIVEGVDIVLEAIDFGDDGLAPNDKGGISIAFNPAVEVRFSRTDELSVMGFFPPDESIDVNVGFEEATIGLESVSAKVNFSYDYKTDKPLATGLGDLQDELKGLEIGGAGLSPVVELSISNPLTIAANFSASITPMVGDERKEDAKIEVKGKDGGPVVIKAAEYDAVTGEIIPVHTKVVLAKPNRADEFAGVDCIFIGCDIDKLINILPTHFDFDASFGLPDEVVTLHMIDNLDMDIAVSLSLPIAFDDKLNISYETTVDVVDSQGHSPLEEVAKIESLKVGDIAVIAKFETTLPLELVLSTTLLDKEGNKLDTKLGFGDENNTIKGSSDGSTPEVSELRWVFDLAAEDGSLEELKYIHSVAMKVEANSVADGVVSLKDEQYIKADLLLELDGGVTVDIEDLMK